jgi:hypothetical protein
MELLCTTLLSSKTLSPQGGTLSLPPLALSKNVATYKDGPSKICKFPIDGQSYEFAFNTTIFSDWKHHVLVVANRGHIATNHHPAQKLCMSFLAEYYLLQDIWFNDPTCMSALSNNLVLDSWDFNRYYFN